MREIWKDIKGYEGLYQISNLGRVKSLRGKQKILKHNERQGYPIVQLSNKMERHSYQIHRLVAEAFIPNPYNYKFINHKDENRKNYSIDNLEWCDSKYNVLYSRRKMYCKPNREDFIGDNLKYIRKKKVSTIKNGKRYTYLFYRVSFDRLKIDKIFSKLDDAIQFKNSCYEKLLNFYNEMQIKYKIN